MSGMCKPHRIGVVEEAAAGVEGALAGGSRPTRIKVEYDHHIPQTRGEVAKRKASMAVRFG